MRPDYLGFLLSCLVVMSFGGVFTLGLVMLVEIIMPLIPKILAVCQ